MDTNDYELSDLDDINFFWENPQSEVDAVFGPVIDSTFTLTAFDGLEIGGSVENPVLLDNENDRDDSPLTTPVSKRPNGPPTLLRSRVFATRIEIVREYVNKSLFQSVISCKQVDMKRNQNVSFYHNPSQKPIKHMWDKNNSNFDIIIVTSRSWFLDISRSDRDKNGTSRRNRYSKLKAPAKKKRTVFSRANANI